ncbi:MAG: mannose-1-phosphate guanylyltransferase/mannose-6-phosphate isomerase [Pseudomonadota bacterium]
MSSPVIPVILCGGSGTRLWPESRKNLPKQFLNLVGDKTLFQQTLERAQSISSQKIVILTNEAMRFLVADELARANIEADVILEPEARDTAAAIAIAALKVSQLASDAVAAIMPSDHYIAPQDVFVEDMARAVSAAHQGSITIFGIVPNAPSTAYGYIATGDDLPDVSGLKRVVAFNEKPDAQKAALYITEGALWNSGLFVARADVLLDAFQMHAPQILQSARTAFEKASSDKDALKLDTASFSLIEKRPFDIAVMEQALNAAVLPARFTWSDIGAFDALWDVSGKDASGNAVTGDVVLEGVSNSIIRSSRGLVAVLGLDNVAVIATDDAVLVAPKKQLQNVRQLVAKLDAQERSEVTDPAITRRPWGSFETKALSDGYRVKRISVKPGGRLSLQKHAHRAEHWVIVKGTARVTIDDQVQDLQRYQSVYIPLGAVHRLENFGEETMELIEVQCGDYLGEDDIVRLEDVYGRGAEPPARKQGSR